MIQFFVIYHLYFFSHISISLLSFEVFTNSYISSCFFLPFWNTLCIPTLIYKLTYKKPLHLSDLKLRCHLQIFTDVSSWSKYLTALQSSGYYSDYHSYSAWLCGIYSMPFADFLSSSLHSFLLCSILSQGFHSFPPLQTLNSITPNLQDIYTLLGLSLPVLHSRKCLQTNIRGNLMAYLVRFPLLGSHSPMLTFVQCVAKILLLLLPSFLIVNNRRAALAPLQFEARYFFFMVMRSHES